VTSVTVSGTDRRQRVTAAATAGVVFGALALLGAGIAVVAKGPFSGTFLIGTAIPYVLAGLIIIARIRSHHPHARFGLANVLTIIRLVLTCLFAGLALENVISRNPIPAAAAWFFFAAATAALVLDGFDGLAARKQGTASAFGSRFDMEVDALLILFLSVAAFALNKAGAWIVMSGALRYIYIVAGWIAPHLSDPLPHSWRRKVISVVQGGTLAALMAPIIMPPLSTFAAAVALALLIYSFAADVFWLTRNDP
jgi:phosphatidylglycerophosphate synthase